MQKVDVCVCVCVMHVIIMSTIMQVLTVGGVLEHCSTRKTKVL